MSSGEEKAWNILSTLKPQDICKNAKVSYSHNSYLIKSFGMEFFISLKAKEIKALTQDGDSLFKRLEYFLAHSLLCYLISAKDIPFSGRLIRPEDVKGGEHFFRGTHLIPIEKLTEKYGKDKDGFIKKGKELNAKTLTYGSASLELLPLPRVPITLILWIKDEEFPPRVSLLFDSTVEFHLPLDIIWSSAMLSVLAMV